METNGTRFFLDWATSLSIRLHFGGKRNAYRALGLSKVVAYSAYRGAFDPRRGAKKRSTVEAIEQAWEAYQAERG